MQPYAQPGLVMCSWRSKVRVLQNALSPAAMGQQVAYCRLTRLLQASRGSKRPGLGGSMDALGDQTCTCRRCKPVQVLAVACRSCRSSGRCSSCKASKLVQVDEARIIPGGAKCVGAAARPREATGIGSAAIKTLQADDGDAAVDQTLKPFAHQLQHWFVRVAMEDGRGRLEVVQLVYDSTANRIWKLQQVALNKAYLQQ
jgi:hypothetical protein